MASSSLTIAVPPPISPVRLALRRARRHGSVMFGGTVLLVMIVMALAAPLLAPHDPYAQELSRRFIPPIWHDKGTWMHILGTDGFGRDYLSRLIYGSRISLLIGFATAILSGLIGTLLGVSAGYFGGRVDLAVNFLITTRLTLPVVLVALVVVAVVGNSLPILILVIGLLLWDRFAVVTRSATQQVASRDFIAAARAIGCSTPRILWQEILPNIMNSLIVVATVEMAHAVLLEAALSFLGLGVQPPAAEWGAMLSRGRELLRTAPLGAIAPGLAITATVLGFSVLGDGLRDAADGRRRGR